MINRTAGVLRLTAAVVCLASLAHVAVLVPRFVRLGQGVSTGGLVFIVGLNVVVFSALGACLLALILLARSWDRPGARSLAIFLAAAATVWAAIMRLLAGSEINVEGGFEVSFVEGSVANKIAAGQGGGGEALLFLFAMMLAPASFLRFSATFPRDLKPRDLPPTKRFPRLRRLRTMLLRPIPVWGLGLAMPLVVILLWFVSIMFMTALAASNSVPLLVAFLIFPVAAMVMGTQNLMVGYRTASIKDRKKLLWLLLGVLVSTWMILVPLLALSLAAVIDLALPIPRGLSLVGDLAVASLMLAPGVLVSALAVAMFYTGSVDPKLVLKRATVLGIIGTVWIMTYAVLESLASQWLATTLGLSEAVVSAGIAVAATAVALQVRKVALPLKGQVSTSGPP